MSEPMTEEAIAAIEESARHDVNAFLPETWTKPEETLSLVSEVRRLNSTLATMAALGEFFKLLASSQLALERSLFFQVAKYACQNQLSWDQAVESILKEIAEYGEDEVPAVRDALARAREQGRPAAVLPILGL